MIPPNFPPLTGPKKSTTDFVVPHSPTLAHTQTHMGSQIMLRGERPLLSPVTLKDPSKAPLDELSSKRSPIKSRMSWPESRTSKTLKIQGWSVVDLNLCLWNSKLQSMMGFKHSHLATQNFKGHGWGLGKEGDPPTREVMKLTAFKMLENCYDFYISARILRTFRVDFQKHRLKGFTPRTSGKWLFKWTTSWAQDICSICFGVNDVQFAMVKSFEQTYYDWMWGQSLQCNPLCYIMLQPMNRISKCTQVERMQSRHS